MSTLNLAMTPATTIYTLDLIFYQTLLNLHPIHEPNSPQQHSLWPTLIMQRCAKEWAGLLLQCTLAEISSGHQEGRSSGSPAGLPTLPVGLDPRLSTAAWISPTHLCGGKDYPDLPAFTDRVLSHSSVPAATRHLITLSNSFFCD